MKVEKVIKIKGFSLIVFYTPRKCWQYGIASLIRKNYEYNKYNREVLNSLTALTISYLSLWCPNTARDLPENLTVKMK